MPLLAADDSYGSIRLTCATFHRINGGSTQLRGVTPDIIIPSTRDGLDIGEDKLPNAVPWSKVPPAQYGPVYPLAPLLADIRSNAMARLANNAEYQQHLRVVEHVRDINERTSVPLLYSERYDMYAAERKLYEDEGLDDIDEEDGSSNAPADGEETPDDGIGKDIVLRASLDVLADLVDRQGQTGITIQTDSDPSDWLLNLFHR
jgi:carboxyl-terminal processing protease